MEKDIRARDLMKDHYDCLLPTASLREAAYLMQAAENRDPALMPGVQALMVVDKDGRLAGLITMFDILREILPPHMRDPEDLSGFAWEGLLEDTIREVANKPVADIMTKTVATVKEDARLLHIMEIMVKKHVRRLPVLNGDGKVAGIVRLPDVFAAVEAKLAGVAAPGEMAPRILICTDGSEPARDATEFAVSLAHRIGAGLVAMRVVDKDRYIGQWEAIGEELASELEVHAKEVLAGAKAVADKEQVGIETVVKHGDASNEIVSYVNENRDIRLVVLGTTGRRKGAVEHILGSTSERVLAELDSRIHCPVVIAPSRSVQPDARLGL